MATIGCVIDVCHRGGTAPEHPSCAEFNDLISGGSCQTLVGEILRDQLNEPEPNPLLPAVLEPASPPSWVQWWVYYDALGKPPQMQVCPRPCGLDHGLIAALSHTPLAAAEAPLRPITVAPAGSVQLAVSSPGSFTVVYSATDASGNMADSAACAVTVVDAERPVLACPAPVTTMFAEPGKVAVPSTHTVLLTVLNATATDNSGVVIVRQRPAPSASLTFGLGTERVDFIATDLAGQLADCSTELVVLWCPAPGELFTTLFQLDADQNLTVPVDAAAMLAAREENAAAAARFGFELVATGGSAGASSVSGPIAYPKGMHTVTVSPRDTRTGEL